MASDRLRPIELLTSDWRAQCATSASRTALVALADKEPEVAELGATDMGELVSWLTTPLRSGARQGTCPDAGARVHAARIVRAMLRSAPVHPMVKRALLQTLVPGLVGVARRLDWGAGGEWCDGDAFFFDLLSTAWEVLEEWAGDDRPYAVLDLLSAVRCRARRRLLGHRAHGLAQAPVADLERVGDEGRAPLAAGCSETDLDVLARVIDEGRATGLDPRDAAALYGQRVLGYSLTELSALTGRSARYLRRCSERAAEVLTA